MSLDKPKLRPVEIFSLTQGGRAVVCLRDPQDIAHEVLALDPDTFFLVALMDGKHSVLDIQTAYTCEHGSLVFSDRIRELIRQLDQQHFLESDEFRIYHDALVEEYQDSPARAAGGAGTNYPAEPAALAQALGAILVQSPSVKGQARPGKLRALIAPHIDFERGAKTYSRAFREVETLEAPLRVLVLGTAHRPTTHLFSLTRKNFTTPLGEVPTDLEYVDALAESLEFDPFQDEFNHRNEHSIELQAVFLKFLFRQIGSVTMVPVLCGGFDAFLKSGNSPAESDAMKNMIDAIGQASQRPGGPTLILAGADLSHVGPQFGDAASIDKLTLDKLQTSDLNLLLKAGRGDAQGFWQEIRDQGGKTRICGLAPIYLMLRLLNGTQGRLLSYEQWHDPSGQAAVSFAAVGYY